MPKLKMPCPGRTPSTTSGEYLTPREFARQYRVSERMVERWRLTGGGPPFIRVGPRRILYRAADCEAWLAERTHASRAAERERAQEQQASR